MDTLPVECITHMLYCLGCADTTDVVRFSMTTKRSWIVANNRYLWFLLYRYNITTDHGYHDRCIDYRREVLEAVNYSFMVFVLNEYLPHKLAMNDVLHNGFGWCGHAVYLEKITTDNIVVTVHTENDERLRMNIFDLIDKFCKKILVPIYSRGLGLANSFVRCHKHGIMTDIKKCEKCKNTWLDRICLQGYPFVSLYAMLKDPKWVLKTILYEKRDNMFYEENPFQS